VSATAAAVRFVTPAGDIRIGRLDGATITDAGPAGPAGFVPDDAGWRQIAAAAGATYASDDVRQLPPVVPTKVICIGLNYRDHAEESELALPEVPIIFSKWPSCLIGTGEAIVLPPEETRPDFEAELAVVFAERFTRAGGAAARSKVGAYCAFHDVSGRHFQLDTPLRQFDLGKSIDTFGPIGPLVPAAGVDLGALDVTCRVSGEVLQHSNTRNLIFGVERLIEYISTLVTIEAGDVLITGTPGGVGDSRNPKRYLVPGDVVEVEVAGAPVLRNPVVSA
jgi:2-keto-4-pentenoate hydratase/2-oxohepta-3-ene-1,7-dioic acid hydratase in catechol pathway